MSVEIRRSRPLWRLQWLWWMGHLQHLILTDSKGQINQWHGCGMDMAWMWHGYGNVWLWLHSASGRDMRYLRSPARRLQREPSQRWQHLRGTRDACPLTSKRRSYSPVSRDGALGGRTWYRLQAKLQLAWVRPSPVVCPPMAKSGSREGLDGTSSQKCEGPLWWSGLRTGGEGWCPGK